MLIQRMPPAGQPYFVTNSLNGYNGSNCGARYYLRVLKSCLYRVNRLEFTLGYPPTLPKLSFQWLTIP